MSKNAQLTMQTMALIAQAREAVASDLKSAVLYAKTRDDQWAHNYAQAFAQWEKTCEAFVSACDEVNNEPDWNTTDD